MDDEIKSADEALKEKADTNVLEERAEKTIEDIETREIARKLEKSKSTPKKKTIKRIPTPPEPERPQTLSFRKVDGAFASRIIRIMDRIQSKFKERPIYKVVHGVGSGAFDVKLMFKDKTDLNTFKTEAKRRGIMGE